MNIIKLIRAKHYVKNLLIFLPLVFSINLLHAQQLINTILGFVVFCLVSSCVYIMNDIKDVEKDRLHSRKCTRPIAAGKITVKFALGVLAVFMLGSIAILIYIQSLSAAIIISIYFALNFSYSFGLKNIAVLEIVILAAGFVLRVYFGGAVGGGLIISHWMMLTVLSAAIYMGLGKRRNEIVLQDNSTREVNTKYTMGFLEKCMPVFMSATIVFYSLWCININAENIYSNEGIVWSIPLVIIALLRYSFLVEKGIVDKDNDGDPTNVLFSDKFLIGLAAVFALLLIIIIYVPINLKL